MKNLIYMLVFGTMILSCTSAKQKDIISETVTKKATSINEAETMPTVIMTNSSNIEPSRKVTIDGINFTIVQNKEGMTTYQSTHDIKFKTPEGYSVGNRLKDISELEKYEIHEELGFGYLIELDSGWQLGFCEGESCTDNRPNENSTIKWIQKRK